MACSAAVGAERETAVSVLRACLVSNKGGVPLSILNRDYKSLNGTPIPYKKLGYDSVEGFLRSVNDIIVKQGPSGELTVHAVPTEASAHIASLVSRQRTTRKRVPVPNICQSRKPTNQSWKPPPSSTSYMNTNRQSAAAAANGNSPRNRLSITVTNNGYDRPSRLVSVKMKQGGATGAGDMRHGGYEMPPRMQRAAAGAVSSQEASRNFPVDSGGGSGGGGTGDSAFGAFEDVNERRLLMNMEENLHIGEEFVANDEEEEITDDVDDFENYQTSTKQRSKKSIVSPFSPRNAIAAGRAKTQAIAVKELEDKYTSVAAVVATRQPQPEDDLQNKELFDDYNMDVAPWNRTKPGLGKINAASYMDTYVTKLKTYSEKKDWAPPEYKMIPRHPRGEGAVYGCQVKVGYDQVFSSYPDESCYPEEAREFAAKKAYNKLIEIDKTKIGNGLKVTTDLNVVHNRIFKLVERHTTGLWAETIPALYSNEYDEDLPPDWLKKANTFSNLCLNYVCKGKVIVSPIQEPSLEETALQNQKLTGASQMAAAAEPSAPEPVAAIHTQVVPSDNMWDVFVTQVEPSGEIWIRIIGADYSEEYENIATEMELYYSKAKRELQSPPADLRVDGYFAARLVDEFSSGDCWHRICVHNINWDLKMVECSLIDNGDVDVLSFKQIYPLDRRFTYLPQQAVLCSLAGLEDYAIDEIMLDLMVTKLVGKALVGQVKNRDEENSIYNLVLFDTQGDDDINLNEHLIECISLEGNKPQLPAEQGVQEVYVSHIMDNGLLYVQIQSDMFTHLLSLIADLSLETIKEHCFKKSLFQSNRCLSLDKLYLAKFNEDGNWYRATIRRPPSPIEHQVDVMFVDYGNVESVDLENICDLEPISEVLVRIPRQALPVMLHSVEVGVKECAKLKEMISDAEPVVLKMISSSGSDGTNIPAVEIFKRTSEIDGGALISINNTITLERELSRSAQRRHSVRRSKSCSRPVTPSISRPGSPVSPAAAVTHILPDIHGDTVRHNLSPPKIPNIGSDYFDIFVTMAANPSNFIVQPLSNLNSLKQLAAKMKSFYTNEADSSYLVKPDNLVEGGLYAALFENNEWYRVTLKKKISDGGHGFTCSVHKCDFGEFIGVSVENLRYLAPQFTELPYQAIKAKLAGIRPRHVDWTVEDCMRFHELVVEKQLVSVVMEKGPDLLNQTPETVLGLQIIDTSTDEDIFIASVLLNEKRAIAEVTLTVN